MRYAGKSTFIVSTALLITALLAPTAAQAVELPQSSTNATATPTLAELTAESTEAAIAESHVAISLTWLDQRLTYARERLAASDSGKTRDAIAEKVTELVDERAALAADADAARREADAAQAALAEAQTAAAAAQAAEAARIRAEHIAAYGLFPVAGPTEFVDSWGFPRSGGRRHKGTDIMAATGTPVVAVKDGVVSSGRSGLGGITLWLETADGTRYYYAHLSAIVVPDGPVTTGQVIGLVGSTGNATASAPHLHFEIHRPNATDPYPVLMQMAR